MLSSSTTAIKALLSKIDANSEFEVMFNNYKPDNKLTITNFMKILNYAKWRADNDKLEITNSTSLDINYNYDTLKAYRITINSTEKINNMLNILHQRKNHVIFSILCSQFSKAEDFEFINKKKDKKDILDVDMYDIRFRLASEEPIDSKELKTLANLQIGESSKINFRYKQRVSLFLNKDKTLRLDLTIVKTASSPDDIQHANKNYELELEYSPKAKSKDIFNTIEEEITRIKKVLENSTIIITKNETNEVLTVYKKLTYGSDVNIAKLYSMQPKPADVQHIVDKIPNRYTVTDKADGEKVQLIVVNNIIYIITNNLVVRKTQYNIKGLDNTIIEGEIFNIRNRYLTSLYDCLYYNNKDTRNIALLADRLEYVRLFAEKINKNIYTVVSYKGKFNIVEQEKHYEGEIEKFYTNLNKLVDSESDGGIIFHPKLFLFPSGGDNCEVYSFANLIWDACRNNPKVKCPYFLDGIIFTAIDQKYTRDKKDEKYPIYKYKPPTTNSIDIYISFQKNYETKGYLDIYDNSVGHATNTVFRVLNFFVGDMIGNKEVPVPFMKEENNHEAFFPLDRGEVRDVEGNIVNDNTVIEVIYVNDMSIPHQYRWSILRTRWDKTEFVIRDKRAYGNFKTVAIDTWRSMREAVTIEEIKKLSRPESYIGQQKQLSARINSQIISNERAQDKYYQKITNLAKLFRDWNNWIKSLLIYTYCSPYHINGKDVKKRILEFGFGRGGDLMKTYHSKVSECVATDYSYEDLFGSIDSATVRYKTNVKKFPDFPKFTFINVDARLPLVSSIQAKNLPNMTADNKNKIDTIFTKNNKFDVINIQFAIHYFFDTNESIKNFTENVNTHLKDDGYLICTLFDSKQIMNLLNGKDTYTSLYTDDEGQRTIFFEIIKKFEGDVKSLCGQTIDVRMGWISDSYLTEYLVTYDLLVDTMKKAGCRLVDTDLFQNMYEINKDWFLNCIQHEANEKNRAWYKKILPFFGDLQGVNKESKLYMDLSRYYIFKKI
jgi:hypothetical protein